MEMAISFDSYNPMVWLSFVLSFLRSLHNYDPLYLLLKRQCYWFANTIYYVISNTYSCTTIPPDFSRVADAASLASTQAMHHSGKILLKSKMVSPSDQFLVGQRSRITPGNAISFDSSCTAIAFLPCATSTILIPYLTVGFFPALNVHRYFSGFLSNRFSEYFLIITCNVRLLRFSLGLLQWMLFFCVCST